MYFEIYCTAIAGCFFRPLGPVMVTQLGQSLVDMFNMYLINLPFCTKKDIS